MASLFGSTSAKPAAAPKTANLDAQRASSNEQGVALRYFSGMQRFALTWLGPAYRQRTKEVRSGGGGKGSTSKASGHDYYADVAGLACLGPVDALAEIWMDRERVWHGNVTRSAGEDSAEIDIEKKGHCTIYWGTETQTAPGVLTDAGHPPYRGQCYLFFQQLYFGRDRTTAPNIEVTLRRQPQAAGLSGDPDFDHDTIAPHAMAELLTNPRYGLGWDAESTLDFDAWNVAAARLRDEQFAFSPLLDRSQTARALLTGFCEYFDGFITAGAGGRLALNLARPNVSDPDDLPLLGEYDLLETPDPASSPWRLTHNEISLRFTDRDHQFQPDAEPWRDLANLRTVGGEPLTLNLDRPWITRRFQAQKAAAWAGRLQSVPWVRAKIVVRKEAAAGIEPGAFVRLTYGDYQETLIMRALRRRVSEDKSQAVELELRADGFFNDLLPYTPDRPPLPDEPEISPQPAVASRVIELPFPLVPAGADRTRPHLAALVARASALDVRYLVYSTEDSITYDEAAKSERFALAGTLADNYPITNILDDGPDGMLVSFGGHPDGETDLEITNERGRQKMRLLVFVGDEILSYRETELVAGTGVRLLGLRRGCYDTRPAAHAAGAPVFIQRRRNLEPFTESTFARGDAVDFKVAPATGLSVLDLSEVSPETLTLADRTARPLPPINLRVNGLGIDPTYASGDDLLVEWDAANWRRHEFWQSFEDAYEDEKLKHRVRLANDGTGANVLGVKIGAGATSYTISNAALVAAFGGSEPAALRVRVLSRRRGMRSLYIPELRVVKI